MFRWECIGVFGLGLLASMTPGCSMKGFEQAKLNFRVQLGEENPDLFSLLSGPHVLGTTPFPAAPSAVSAFSCFAVNVMGSGIPSIDTEVTDAGVKVDEYFDRQSYCTYPGVTSPTFTYASVAATGGSKTVSLSVNTGPKRIVQLLGIMRFDTGTNSVPTPPCPSSIQEMIGSDDGSTIKTTAWLLSDALLGQFTTSQSIALNSNPYDPANPHQVDCGGGGTSSSANLPNVVATVTSGACNSNLSLLLVNNTGVDLRFGSGVAGEPFGVTESDMYILNINSDTCTNHLVAAGNACTFNLTFTPHYAAGDTFTLTANYRENIAGSTFFAKPLTIGCP